MSPLAGIALILLAPVFVVALVRPHNEPTPPIGWWFVIVMAELSGAAIGAVVYA